MTFRLARMTAAHRPGVLMLRVHESQTPFVEPIAETLEIWAGRRDNHVMLAGDDVAGLFQVDASSPKRLPFISEPNTRAGKRWCFPSTAGTTARMRSIRKRVSRTPARFTKAAVPARNT